MTHIYRPVEWKRKLGYRVHADQCRAAVHEGGRGVGFHQCSRKPTVRRVVDGTEYGFCSTHDPVRVAEKRKDRQDKWDREWAAKQAGWARDEKLRVANDAARKALEAIAAGHNDARSLAQETLALYPAEPAEGEQP